MSEMHKELHYHFSAALKLVMYVSMECLLIWKSSILGITANIKFQGKTVYQRFRALITYELFNFVPRFVEEG